MSHRHRISAPATRRSDHDTDECCQLNSCCGCTSKQPPVRRRKIRHISQPLRPDELNRILSQYASLEVPGLPSAWIGPYAPQSKVQWSASQSNLQNGQTNRQPISRSLDPFYQVPYTAAQKPLHIHLPTQSSQPYRSHTGPTSLPQSSVFDQSPLAYSLSAELASVGKHRFRLTYVTDRLLVISYPLEAQESDHNEGARWLCQAFERRYGSNYRIFNLSGFTKELHLSSRVPVVDLFWPIPLSPGLEQLVTAIDQLDYWLHNHDNNDNHDPDSTPTTVIPPERVAVLHCTGPRSLLATYLAVYICQSKARFGPLCGQRPGSPTARGLRWNEDRFRRFQNELVLGHTILKRFYEDNLAMELTPSQKRYVGYFSGLVTGALILQDRLIYLHAVVYRSPSIGGLVLNSMETSVDMSNNHADNLMYAYPQDIFIDRGDRDEESPDPVNPSGWGEMQNVDWARKRRNIYGLNVVISEEQAQARQPINTIQKEYPLTNGSASIESSTRMKKLVMNELSLFVKIYQNLKLMHTTRILCPNINFPVEKYIFPIEPVLPLHGDIIIACFIQPAISESFQEIIFRIQFHTCATNAEMMTFYKHDLDEACTDNRFPQSGCVEVHFSPNPELIIEHHDNIDRGGYTWTSTDRESNILSVGVSTALPHHYSGDVGTSSFAQISQRDKLSKIENQAHRYPPLSVIITTRDYYIPESKICSAGDIGPYREVPMWSGGGQQTHFGERIHRAPLNRQSSDPSSLPASDHGRGSRWSEVGPLPTPQQPPLFQQALLSPRVQIPSSGTLQYELAATSRSYPAPSQTAMGGIPPQLDRLDLAQLQALYQQLLNQQDALLRRSQQQQLRRPTYEQGKAMPVDSNMYATVQRPTGNELLALLNLVQRAIIQQQHQQRQIITGTVQYPQPPTAVPTNINQVLSGLSTSTALTNLVRALLPNQALPMDFSTRLSSYQGGMPMGQTQLLQVTPQGLAYVPTQSRTEQGALGGVGEVNDMPLLSEQHRRSQLQRNRLMLDDQERRLLEELRALKLQKAGLSRQELIAVTNGVTSLDSYRQMTGRGSTAESGQRGRGHGRALQVFGRSGSADAAGAIYGGHFEQEHNEDAALLALLEQRLARAGNRPLYSDNEAYSRTDKDIPLKVVGPQQRSGHVVDGSSQAISGELAPGGAVRVFLPIDTVTGGIDDNQILSPADLGAGKFTTQSADYATLSDLIPYPDTPDEQFERSGDTDREFGYHPRHPRITLDRSPTDHVHHRYIPHQFTPSDRARTFSDSPSHIPLHPSGHPSPARRLHYLGSGRHMESAYQTGGLHQTDLSPGVSPTRTPSTRLLQSPTSPLPRQMPHDRRFHAISAMDTGSQSDTGLIGGHHYGSSWSAYEHGIRRPHHPYRGSRMTTGYHRGRSEQTQHSPMIIHGSGDVCRTGSLDHVPEAALIALNRLSASAHIWYRPEMSRSQSIELLKNDPPGTFVVRNSGSFQHSFGLVVRIDRFQTDGHNDDSEIVRHYLIEGLPSTPNIISQAIGVTAASLAPTNVSMGPVAMSVTHGPVLLRGSSTEPIFTNLVSLLYEHVVQPLALPLVLRLPFKSPTPVVSLPSLINLSRGIAERTDRGPIRSRYRPQLVKHWSEESPHASQHRYVETSRRTLTRHPSDPLPSDVTIAGAGGIYYKPYPPHAPHSASHRRQDAQPFRSTRDPPSYVHSRSPPLSSYETDMGPIHLGGPTGKWQTFIAIYLGSIDTENLTGSSAIRKAVDVLLDNASQVKQTEVTVKVTQDGLTVTDNWRKLFFRRHYPFFSVSHCAIDPGQRCWQSQELRKLGNRSSRIFGFVARKQDTRENMCHVLCDTPDYSATTITDFIMHKINEY